MIRLAIFASGSGSNAETIVHHFSDHPNIQVSLILSNRSDAGVLDRAKRLNIPSIIFKKAEFNESKKLLSVLSDHQIEFIVLAGFLLLIPSYLIEAFPNKIVNIHPALLPKYGGKGMYGHHVHNAVEAAGEKESGITIHYVNDKYDEGQIIFQARTKLRPGETSEGIAKKVQILEHEYYPKLIEQILKKKFQFFS